MVKIRNISEIQPTLPLTEFDFAAKYRAEFAASELGRIRNLLPLSDMASTIAIRFPKRTPQGKKPMFSPEGEIALMFLKSYTCLSDDGLIEMFNGSVYMQMFCGVLLDPSNPIKDGKIVSAIRNRLAGKLDIKALQKVLYAALWYSHDGAAQANGDDRASKARRLISRNSTFSVARSSTLKEEGLTLSRPIQKQ